MSDDVFLDAFLSNVDTFKHKKWEHFRSVSYGQYVTKRQPNRNLFLGYQKFYIGCYEKKVKLYFVIRKFRLCFFISTKFL